MIHLVLPLHVQNEMFFPSGEYAESRPFKIFISLLDKWEIGSALTEALVLDAFKAIKIGIDSGRDTGEDVRHCVAKIGWVMLIRTILDDHDSEHAV